MQYGESYRKPAVFDSAVFRQPVGGNSGGCVASPASDNPAAVASPASIRKPTGSMPPASSNRRLPTPFHLLLLIKDAKASVAALQGEGEVEQRHP